MVDELMRFLVSDEPFGLIFRQAGERRPAPFGEGRLHLILPGTGRYMPGGVPPLRRKQWTRNPPGHPTRACCPNGPPLLSQVICLALRMRREPGSPVLPQSTRSAPFDCHFSMPSSAYFRPRLIPVRMCPLRLSPRWKDSSCSGLYSSSPRARLWRKPVRVSGRLIRPAASRSLRS